MFDSNYANSFLKKRESDDLLMLPYHLGIFAEIITLIDELKEKAFINRKEQLDAIQQPLDGQLTDKVIAILSKDKLEDEDFNFFLQTFNSYNEEFEEKLLSLEIEHKTLLETNFSDKKQLNIITQQEYKRVNEVYLTYIEKWMGYSIEYHNLYEKKKEYDELSSKRKSTLTVLTQIPGTDFDTWKTFLKSANEYVEENGIDECPYCHRAYDDESLLLVKAYAEFLNNDIELQLSEINSKIKLIADDNSISQSLDELTSVEHIDKEMKETINK